jgi:hypothetical protein
VKGSTACYHCVPEAIVVISLRLERTRCMLLPVSRLLHFRFSRAHDTPSITLDRTSSRNCQEGPRSSSATWLAPAAVQSCAKKLGRSYASKKSKLATGACECSLRPHERTRTRTHVKTLTILLGELAGPIVAFPTAALRVITPALGRYEHSKDKRNKPSIN